jgi:dolichyl-phosphate-mannose-protein mannosyltransferase
MRIKLRHIATDKHLHSHDIRPPVSDVDFQNEVSAYGMKGFSGDANDDWILEIDHGDRKDPESGKKLRTLRTTFRLRHALTGCYLFSHKVKLPEWGFEQQEVTCNKNAVRDNSLWYVETAMHEACACFFVHSGIFSADGGIDSLSPPGCTKSELQASRILQQVL